MTAEPVPGRAIPESTLPESPLPDGRYDVFVVDAVADPTDASLVIRVEVTVTSGPLKGEVVAVETKGLVALDLDLLGMPADLDVEAGVPRLTFGD